MLHSRKEKFSYALHKPHEQKKNSKESLTTIFCTVIIYLYIYLTENCGCHDDTVTDIHRQSQARNGVLVYRIVQNT